MTNKRKRIQFDEISDDSSSDDGNSKDGISEDEEFEEVDTADSLIHLSRDSTASPVAAGASTSSSDSTPSSSSTKPNSETASTDESARAENWELHDSCLLVDFIFNERKSDVRWDKIGELFKDRHRQIEKTPQQICNHWRNIRGKNSKFFKPFKNRLKRPKFTKRMNQVQRDALMKDYEERVANNKAKFEAAKIKIEAINKRELLSCSSHEKTEEQISSEMASKGNERKAIREKRTAIAQQATELEVASTAKLLQQVEAITQDIERRKKVDDLLTRIFIRSFGNEADQRELQEFLSGPSPSPSPSASASTSKS